MQQGFRDRSREMTEMMVDYLKKVASRKDLSEEEAYNCMSEMISGRASNVHIAAILTGLAVKRESAPEITGFSRAMRDACINVNPDMDIPLVDTCGTGGDRFKTFNVSTAASLIAAACGVAIAKHGNRSITSKCGGADVLEALGVNINCGARGVEHCLEDAGIGFMFAPNFHPAMKHVMPVRKELGIRTVFNIIGPLTSPAKADIQLLGVFDPEYVEVVAEVLKNLGLKRAMVVHGFDDRDEPAMDEISTIGKTRVALLDEGKIKVFDIYPEDFGIERADPEYIKAPETLEGNLDVVRDVLVGKRGDEKDRARLDMCLANSAAILFISGQVETLKEGFKMAEEVVESGAASKKLEEFIRASNSL